MTISKMLSLWQRMTATWLWFLAGLVAAVALWFLPPRWTGPLKQSAAGALSPGQRVVWQTADSVRGWTRRAGVKLPTITFADSTESKAARQAAENPADKAAEQALRVRLQQLEAEVTWLRNAARQNAPQGGAGEPLLAGQLIPARVLGVQARQFLAARNILDVGSKKGAEEGNVVLSIAGNNAEGVGREPALLDVGGDAQAMPGRLVLAGRGIVGKLREVGRSTSTVERVTDAGFRDQVRLVHQEDGQLVPGPRGTLVGNGSALCRIQHVSSSQPVAAGDVVYAAACEGVVAAPPRYGTVVRVQQVPGTPDWDIWVRPAANFDDASEVSVLKTELNTPGK
ncbi:MAG: hypothetical protein K8T25_05610 [Planctomycetia bacterium]|nr:hypothetical protein [Planctomycetia bacterium]